MSWKVPLQFYATCLERRFKQLQLLANLLQEHDEHFVLDDAHVYAIGEAVLAFGRFKQALDHCLQLTPLEEGVAAMPEMQGYLAEIKASLAESEAFAELAPQP
ncbi:MAG: hypothetical protein OXT67_07420 [Zetaproteobacteria bacterium]|nr:hypothetical protein [Zetaproteobacteria bacterium]